MGSCLNVLGLGKWRTGCLVEGFKNVAGGDGGGTA